MPHTSSLCLRQDVAPEDAEESWIVRERTPVGFGKVPEFVERGAADLARAVRVGAGVVDQAAPGAFADLGLAEINHAVEGHVAALLAVEEEVAGLGAIQVAREQVRVAQLQGLGLGKLGEAAGGQVGGLESTGFHAEKIGA